jgi:hypothetical protein
MSCLGVLCIGFVGAVAKLTATACVFGTVRAINCYVARFTERIEQSTMEQFGSFMQKASAKLDELKDENGALSR